MINNESNTAIALDSEFTKLVQDAYDNQCATFMEQYVDGCVELFTGETLDAYVSRMWAEAAEFLNAELNHGAEIIKTLSPTAIDPLAAMKRFNQWIVWREEPNPKPDGKPIKEPKNPANGFRANALNPLIWVSYADAVAAADRLSKRSSRPYRVGFTFTSATKLFFFDLDNCINPETGEISAEASELIAMFPGCMVERSVSGKGLHVVGTYEGDEPAHECKSEGWLELYTNKRFMALGQDEGRTGDAGVIATGVLNDLIAMHFKPSADAIVSDGKEVTAEWTTEYDPKWNGYVDIDEQLAKALAASPSNTRLMAGKASFAELHKGSNEGFPGDSEADAAYFFDLAYWFGRNCDVMETAALSGNRVRDKWEGQTYSDGHTWLQREIMAAVARQTKVYDKDYKSDVSSSRQVLSQEEYMALMAEAQRKAVADGIDHVSVDILRHLDDSHIWKRMSQHFAYLQDLPISSSALMVLSVFSSISCRKYIAVTDDGWHRPLGLLAVAEQPSSTGKSRVIGYTQGPFEKILDDVRREFELGFKDESLSVVNTPIAGNDELKHRLELPLFVTNTTSEAMDIWLKANKGYISLASAEQGLINSVLGILNSGQGKDKRSNNNDTLLNLFDGQRIGSLRIGRVPFSGRPVGGVACFAQDGLVETILEASNGTGVSERFLMIVENHNLGNRDHMIKRIENKALFAEYAEKCQFFRDVLINPLTYDDLEPLKVSESAMTLIAIYKNKIEPHLKNGGKFSHISIRGAAGKADSQIIKIAANLQVLDDPSRGIVEDKYITAAIEIFNDLLEANLKLCRTKGIIGQKAEYEAITAYLSRQYSNQALASAIQNSLKSTQPFKDFTGSKSQAINDALSGMVSDGLLTASKPIAGKGLTYKLN